MPFLNIKYSKTITKEQEEVLKKEIGEAIEVIPGKSESWLMINFEGDSHLYFKGKNNDPILLASLSVYGNVDSKYFNLFTERLTKILIKNIDIKKENIYVKYDTTLDWGWNGENF